MSTQILTRGNRLEIVGGDETEQFTALCSLLTSYVRAGYSIQSIERDPHYSPAVAPTTVHATAGSTTSLAGPKPAAVR